MECQTSPEAYLDRLAVENELWRERQRLAKQELIADIRREIDGLPRDMMFEHYDMPTFQPVAYGPIRVFYLGAFNYAWADNLSGRTSLYLSENGELYEYGPLRHEPSGIDEDPNDITRTHDNPLELRHLDLQTLDRWELTEARYLLRRLWV